jgi:hypothetical protein
MIRKSTQVADKVILKIKKAMPKESEYWMQPYQNGREHGQSLIASKSMKQVAFSEYRNSDSIVVYAGDMGEFSNAGNIPSEEIYGKKKFFRYDDFEGAAKFIVGFLESE